MEENLKHIELIEAYHEGKLSQEEKVEFEVRLLVDQELQEENELYKKILYGFHDIKTDQIRAKLRQIDTELDRKKKGGSGLGKYFWLAGIAAALTFFLLLLRSYYSEPSFSSNYIPKEPGLPVLMGSGSKLEFDNAMSAFKAGDYPEAIKGFSKSLTTYTGKDTTLYYLGVCYLHTGNYTKSIEALSQLKASDSSFYFAKSQYFLALAYWASGNTNKAKDFFNLMASKKGHPFAEQSKILLNKLH